MRLIARVLALPADDAERADPWWVYEIGAGSSVSIELLADLRQRILSIAE